jgi:glycosyltransferase involved in cell wall biosynthesis
VRIYWYWPYIHTEELELPLAVPRAGDELVLHTLRDRVDPAVVAGSRVQVSATLAAPADKREHSVAWAADRLTTYTRRVAQRRRALRDGRFDVCHVVFTNYFSDGVDLRRIARRTPIVFEVHDVVPHQSRVPTAVERALLSFLYRGPGHIVARHEYVRDELVTRFHIDPERITIVPMDVPSVACAGSEQRHDRPKVLFFGTLRRNKGVSVLLRAIDELRALSDIDFVFAGRGFAEIEHEVRAAAARDARIRFENGYISSARKHELFAGADLVVLPYTDFASMSGVLCDAYAYHRPVVATDVGGLGASVRGDETGWVIAPSDVAALAAAIEAAITDDTAWRIARQHAAQVAQARSAEHVGAALRALYDR